MAKEATKNYDVILKVGNMRFPCYRKVLAEQSPYFQAMFGEHFVEREKSTIEIQGVDPDAMAVLLQSVERKEVDILKSNDILSVLQASSMLQFESVQKICIDMIVHQWLTVSTCLQTMIIADELDLITLKHKAQALALWEFAQVKDTDTFFELTIDYLEKYLRNNGLNTTEGEFEVFEAGLYWLQDRLSERKEHVRKILNCVRFVDISPSDITSMLLYPVISEDEECAQILQCIICIKEETVFDVFDSDVQTQTSTSSTRIDSEVLLEEENSWVPEQKKAEVCSLLNNCCSCCSVTKAASTPEDDRSVDVHSCDHVRFSSETFMNAKQLLSVSSRSLPVFPCVVGHKMCRLSSKRKISEDDMETEKVIDNNGKPYLIYFQEEKAQYPIPFLHLSKANEGPLEPTGYKIVCKGQDLYMIGGEYLLGYGNWNKSIWKYDVIREVWKYETSIASPRRHHSVCCMGDYIYIIGGFGRHRVIMDSVEKYHVGSKCWSRCASLPHSLYSAACCTHKDQIFVFGPQVYYYHPSSDSWFIMAETILPSNIAFTSAMPHGEWIYLTGTYSKELYRFSPELSAHSAQRFEFVGRFHQNTSNTCLVNSVIYSFSTDDSDSMYIEAYSTSNHSFSVLWSSVISKNTGGILDFSPKHSIGCFPLIKY
ncbi:kelch-like protein 38 isoform X1 [Periplaneta americana]|uniref:kelch-like protein 38 isoform X1 n=2 Tax=Periplaneta americana TaxID=6978 RepID=UPI0037E7F709